MKGCFGALQFSLTDEMLSIWVWLVELLVKVFQKQKSQCLIEDKLEILDPNDWLLCQLQQLRFIWLTLRKQVKFYLCNFEILQDFLKFRIISSWKLLDSFFFDHRRFD